MGRMPLKTIFQDPDLQGRLQEQGFLVMPFLSEEALAELRELYGELHAARPSEGFYSSTFSPDLDFKKRISDVAGRLFSKTVADLFKDVKGLGASFLNKQPGEEGKMPIHQDWTVCAEEEGHFTCTIWVPLQDVGPENGAIKVLPGSHRYTNALRGPTLPVVWREVMEVLEEKMETLEMKAGEAFIFDHALLHSSHLNTSQVERLAVTYGLTHVDTEIVYHWRAQENAGNGQLTLPNIDLKAGEVAIERIHTGVGLFMGHPDVRSRPDFGTHQGFWRQDLKPVTEAECRALMSGERDFLDRPAKRVAGSLILGEAPEHRSILKDSALDERLREEGHVVFPLLDAEAVQSLRAFFFAHHAAQPERFYASAHVSDIDFRKSMSAKVQEVLGPLFEAMAKDAELLGGSFIAKPPGKQGLLPPHADWNIVDERQARSYNLWIPLVDVREENGAVFILRGSHKWFDSVRGPGIPNAFAEVGAEVWDFMEPLEMRAGEALLYDHRLVHGSPLNQTDELRLACVAGVIGADVEMRHHTLRQGLLASYRSHVGFFLEGDPEAGTGDLELLELQAYGFPMVSQSDLEARYGKKETVNEIPEAAHLPGNGFWKTYTLGNIWRELKWRLRGRH